MCLRGVVRCVLPNRPLTASSARVLFLLSAWYAVVRQNPTSVYWRLPLPCAAHRPVTSHLRMGCCTSADGVAARGDDYECNDIQVDFSLYDKLDDAVCWSSDGSSAAEPSNFSRAMQFKVMSVKRAVGGEATSDPEQYIDEVMECRRELSKLERARIERWVRHVAQSHSEPDSDVPQPLPTPVHEEDSGSSAYVPQAHDSDRLWDGEVAVNSAVVEEDELPESAGEWHSAME